jgi:hypothetical protein
LLWPPLSGSGNNTGVVIRGIGPSLSQSGLSNVLADPTLELRDSNGMLLIANDNWQDDPASAAQLSAHALAPQDPKECGIFASLPPGAFTAILAGKNGGTGVGLVEIYNVHECTVGAAVIDHRYRSQLSGSQFPGCGGGLVSESER